MGTKRLSARAGAFRTNARLSFDRRSDYKAETLTTFFSPISGMTTCPVKRSLDKCELVRSIKIRSAHSDKTLMIIRANRHIIIYPALAS